MPKNREIEGLDAELRARGRESRWERYRLPVELEGRSFLDVGCWEGVHCADAVRHGSPDVVGIDVCTSDGLIANVDRYGFEMSVVTEQGPRPARVAFDTEIATPDEARTTLVALVKKARAQLAG